MIALRQDVIMSQTERDRPSVLRAARERTRAEITRAILDAARRHLATDGASGLSLRAIARELGASSSAVYGGIVASRDELLTRLLIVAAYDTLGSRRRDGGGSGWTARTSPAVPLGGGLRRRSGAGPGQSQRVRPDLRHARAGLHRPGRHHRARRPRLQRAPGHPPRHRRRAPGTGDGRRRRAPRRPGRPVAARSIAGPEVPSALLHQGLMAWAALFGTVSFELFGQLHGIIGEQPGDREAYFAESVRRWAAQLGITPAGTAPAARKPARPREPA